MQLALRAKVYLYTKYVLQFELQAHHAQQRSSRRKIDQHVHIATFIVLSSRHGPKHAYPACAARCRQRQDVAALGVECFGRTHCRILAAFALRQVTALDNATRQVRHPGRHPVEQVALFERVVNVKVAKMPGVTIARSMLSRADLVIE